MSFIVSYGIGSIIGFIIVLTLMFWLVRDIVQKKHSVLRNYPLIGLLRYFLESQGEYIRQYFIAGECDEMPFNRAARNWIYRTTNDLRELGSIIFVNAPFSILECDQIASPAVTLGEDYCREPYTARSPVNISGMSFGALSAPAIQVLPQRIAGWIRVRVACRRTICRAIAKSLCRSAPRVMAYATSTERVPKGARWSCPGMSARLGSSCRRARSRVAPGSELCARFSDH